MPFCEPHRREVQERRTTVSDLPAEIVKALVDPARARTSRAPQLDKLEKCVKGMGAGASRAPRSATTAAWTQSPLAKTVTPELRAGDQRRAAPSEGDL